MVGYLNQPERTAQTLVDGWLDTGDLGFLHEGELFVTGRSKDLLILRGRNHAPHEVEQAVDNVDGVRVGCAAAVSFLPEGGDHERLLLFVEAKDPAPGLEQRCAAAVLNSTHLAVDEVILLEPGTLPRTSSGKIRRAEALRLYQLGELRPPRAVTPMLVAGALLRGTLGHWSKRG
jgi:acyl-CoA synthetase (AMP-forming)/AMP-acid ligase II